MNLQIFLQLSIFLIHYPSLINSKIYYAVKTESDKAAKLISRNLDSVFHGQIGSIPNHYLISQETRDSNQSIHLLSTHPLISYAIKQVPRQRIRKAMVVENDEYCSRQIYEKRDSIIDDGLDDIKDPGFQNQWHLFNSKTLGNDINVKKVWAMNITGIGVTSAVIDDGVDIYHDDIHNNFNFEASYDFNEKTSLPVPRLADDFHGTRCAGEIAAVRNEYCGVGVAYGSKVSGIRILGGPITDKDEALALNYRMDINDIFSCSWGPQADVPP